MSSVIQQQTIESAIVDVLRSIGEDPQRSGLRDTPQRVADMYRELFAGLHQDPFQELQVAFEEGHHDLVILRDISFYSMCEHHLLPFFGSAHVAYLPNGRVVGVSKLIRALEILARRPQLQERLTGQLADVLFAALEAEGVAVVMQAEHLCISMRGVQKPGALVVTSAIRGTFRRGSLARREVLAILGGSRS
ncbi:MAG: GTP cyclohydrolase I FolE [Chloroflexi bacterium]|nr:GTP cyclohydrolase I FolE [Chloroflexota bacterium]